jgi:hypothetical protein
VSLPHTGITILTNGSQVGHFHLTAMIFGNNMSTVKGHLRNEGCFTTYTESIPSFFSNIRIPDKPPDRCRYTLFTFHGSIHSYGIMDERFPTIFFKFGVMIPSNQLLYFVGDFVRR